MAQSKSSRGPAKLPQRRQSGGERDEAKKARPNQRGHQHAEDVLPRKCDAVTWTVHSERGTFTRQGHVTFVYPDGAFLVRPDDDSGVAILMSMAHAMTAHQQRGRYHAD
jgi:hypothetical protein